MFVMRYVPPPTWAVNNITEEEAEQFCREGITGTQSYSVCSEYLETVDPLVEKCKLDIKVGG